MKKIELILSNTFIYRGKVFEKGRTYGVSDADARHLLAQANERAIPYFRMTEAEPAVAPTDKPGKEPVIVESEPKPIAEQTDEGDDGAGEELADVPAAADEDNDSGVEV